MSLELLLGDEEDRFIKVNDKYIYSTDTPVDIVLPKPSIGETYTIKVPKDMEAVVTT